MENDIQEHLYLYILSLLPVRRLEIFESWASKAGSFEKIYYAEESQLIEFGLGWELILKLRKIKSDYSVERLLKSIERTGVKTVPYYSKMYPKLLKQIHDTPPVLFYRGKLIEGEEICIGVVGSRKMSSYGAMAVSNITTPLINAGVTIVSGLAYGVDSAAHAESIKVGARTIAVLGSGVDSASVYPRGHFRLAEEILENDGLIISEQPPGMPGLKHNFIARNRIIAGLSIGVVIVEAKKKSGALLTADYALDFNRTVYAIPGPIHSSLSYGPHALIQSGATLITTGDEIIEDLEISSPKLLKNHNQARTHSLSEVEQLMLKCMQDKAMGVNLIARLTKIDAKEILQTLTKLELNGLIKKVGSENFSRV